MFPSVRPSDPDAMTKTVLEATASSSGNMTVVLVLQSEPPHIFFNMVYAYVQNFRTVQKSKGLFFFLSETRCSSMVIKGFVNYQSHRRT